MFHGKHITTQFFGKGFGDKLIGAGKGLARVMDEPITQAIVSGLAPGVGPAYAGLKSTGILEKIKHS